MHEDLRDLRTLSSGPLTRKMSSSNWILHFVAALKKTLGLCRLMARVNAHNKTDFA